MNLGLEGRALNGAECRALRTSLHLERRHLTRLVNVMGLMRGPRCQNDDIGKWEAQVGYPRALVEVLTRLDEAASALAVRLHADAGLTPGVRAIQRPQASEISAALPLVDVGLILDEPTRAVLMGDEGDVWQRLFDAVVVKVGELCVREGSRLTIARGA